jgi:hypothetical protein
MTSGFLRNVFAALAVLTVASPSWADSSGGGSSGGAGSAGTTSSTTVPAEPLTAGGSAGATAGLLSTDAVLLGVGAGAVLVATVLVLTNHGAGNTAVSSTN